MFNIKFNFFLNGEYIQIYLEQMIDLIFIGKFLLVSYDYILLIYYCFK